MKRYVKASYGVEDILSYRDKEQLAEDIFRIVRKYFRSEGAGSPSPRVSFSEYDIYAYTFRVNSGTLNRDVRYVASTDYNAPDLNQFKKDVRALLKSRGFNKVKFDIGAFKYYYEWYGKETYDQMKELRAIYFE